MKLIERFPWLVVAGGGLLGYIAGEMAVEDAAVEAVDRRATRAQLHWIAPAVGVAIVVAVGVWLTQRRRKRRGADATRLRASLAPPLAAIAPGRYTRAANRTELAAEIQPAIDR